MLITDFRSLDIDQLRVRALNLLHIMLSPKLLGQKI